MNYRYGMKEACTDRLASLEKDRARNAPSSIESFMTAFFLFYAPYTYLDRLEKVWAERSVPAEGWQKLVASLLAEWSDSNLLVSASIRLLIEIASCFDTGNCYIIVRRSSHAHRLVINHWFSANMAFLALQDIRSLSRTASIVSTNLAIGSIAVGLHHVWRHRQKFDSDSMHVVRLSYIHLQPRF